MSQTRTRQIVPFVPLDWQVEPWRDKSRIMLLSGTAGGGKSHLAANKVHAFALHYPGTTGVLVRKTREVMKSSVVDFMRNVVIGDDPRVTYRPSDYRFIYENGSAVIWAGMKDKQQREQVRSIGQTGGVDIIWMEEATAFEEYDFNELLPRMRGRAVENYWISKGYSEEEARRRGWRQIILTTNPDNPFHWIKQRLIDGGEAAVYLSRYDQNVHNPDDYRAILEGLTGVQRKRLLDGLWTQAEGMVYDEWSPELHMIEPFPIPTHWERYRVFDFGYTNPFVCLWVAFDDDGRAYIYRQHVHTEMLISQHVELIKNASVYEEGLITANIADWEAEPRAQLEAAGIATVKADKNIEAGIQNVKRRLVKAGDGKPRLFVFKNCLIKEDQKLKAHYQPTSFEQEIYHYLWDEESSRLGMKELPVKRHDHTMDAIRYMFNYYDSVNDIDIVPVSAIYREEG